MNNFFAQRFSKCREETGTTYSELSKSTGISVRALKYYATGEREPSISALSAIASYFDVPTDYLLGRGPFACWDKVMKHHDYICKQIVKEEPFWNDFPVPLDKLSERQFMAVVGATLDNIEYKEKDGQEHFTLTFFPLYV